MIPPKQQAQKMISGYSTALFIAIPFSQYLKPRLNFLKGAKALAIGMCNKHEKNKAYWNRVKIQIEKL